MPIVLDSGEKVRAYPRKQLRSRGVAVLIERARGVCIVIDNDSDNLYITVTAKARIITCAGQARYAQAMRNSGADEVIIPEYEGGLMPAG